MRWKLPGYQRSKVEGRPEGNIEKIFTPCHEVRNGALKLAYRLYQDGFIPDVIYVPLRGGAYMGNVFSEFFKIVRRGRGEHPVFYAAVVARSYTDLYQNERVMIDGWTYDPQYLRNGDKILFVDDVYDSGQTLNHLVGVILEQGIPRRDVRVAVHDYKCFHYKRVLPILPDYYCRRFDIHAEGERKWIYYMSHELVGLNEEEQAQLFPLGQDKELEEVFKVLNSFSS